MFLVAGCHAAAVMITGNNCSHTTSNKVNTSIHNDVIHKNSNNNHHKNNANNMKL